LKNEKFMDVRAVKSRRKLKKALIKLMTDQPYSTLTVQDVVGLAGVNRGTFYNHFESLAHLLNELFDEIVKGLIDAFREPYANVESFKISELSPSAVTLFQNVYRHRDFYRMIVRSDVSHLFRSKLTDTIAGMGDYYVAHSRINGDISNAYHAAAVVGLIFDWVANGFVYSPDYMAEQLLAIVTINGESVHQVHSPRK